MASKLIKGKDVILSIYDDDSEGAYKPVACLTDNTYSLTVDETEGDANKCDDVPPKQYGDVTCEITVDGQILDPTDTDYSDKSSAEVLDALAWSKEEFTWKMDGGYDTKYGTGVITSYDEGYPADGIATFSATISVQDKPSDEDPTQGD